MTYEPKTPHYHNTLESTIPSLSRRYDNAAPVNQIHVPVASIFSRGATEELKSTEGWKRHVNPEGKPYFYHADRRLVTDSNAVDARTRVTLFSFADQIAQQIAESGSTLPEGSEIYLDVDDDGYTCRHYIADHHQCSIGWLDTQLTTEALGLPTVHSQTHLETKKLEEYSLHLEYFPAHVTVSPQLEESVVGQLAYCCVDSITSQGTTSPYTAVDCKRFLKALKYAPKNSCEKNWIIGRVSSQLARSRFMNYHGEDAARLDRSQSLHPVQQESSTWRSHISRCLLFDMPLKHQSRLEALWVDRIIYVTMWQQCMQSLVSELRDTLCMAVFVWFASLTSLLLPIKAGIPFRAMTMVTTILSFSSAISAVIHIRKHRNRPSDTATEASIYLENSEHENFGLQPLAMILSIPSALLTWSFVTCGLSLLMLILSCNDMFIGMMLTGFSIVMAHVVVMVLRFPSSQRP